MKNKTIRNIKKVIDHTVASAEITKLAREQAKANGFKTPLKEVVETFIMILTSK